MAVSRCCTISQNWMGSNELHKHALPPERTVPKRLRVIPPMWKSGIMFKTRSQGCKSQEAMMHDVPTASVPRVYGTHFFVPEVPLVKRTRLVSVAEDNNFPLPTRLLAVSGCGTFTRKEKRPTFCTSGDNSRRLMSNSATTAVSWRSTLLMKLSCATRAFALTLEASVTSSFDVPDGLSGTTVHFAKQLISSTAASEPLGTRVAKRSPGPKPSPARSKSRTNAANSA
mmetsp:Transcript_65188/g.169394  ORF Transcript_65188/g.169394 Transcript_65188/m.169394 type:complete len:227 (-) Transcript_65188:221-901(-)